MFHVQIVNFPFLSFSFAALSDGGATMANTVNEDGDDNDS